MNSSAKGKVWICPKCKQEHLESEKMFGCSMCGYKPASPEAYAVEWEDKAVFIANLVYGYQGSDLKIQEKQINRKYAGEVLSSLLQQVREQDRREVVEKIQKMKKPRSEKLIHGHDAEFSIYGYNQAVRDIIDALPISERSKEV